MNADLPHSQSPQLTSPEVGLPDSASGSEALFRCSKCKQMFPDSAFYREKAGASKRQCSCKHCVKCAARRYYAANKKLVFERHTRYYTANKKRIIERELRYRKANRERIASRRCRWRKANSERAAEYCRRWREANRDKVNAAERERRRNSPNFRLACTLRKRLYNALKSQNALKSAHTMDLIGCTISQLRQHLEKQFQPGMSWDNRSEWHVDHIRPCASFDLKDPEQQKQCFHYANLQPLWAKENQRKNDSLAP